MNIGEIVETIEENNHIYSILKDCPYRILKKWSVKSYRKGELIIRQGEIFKYFYIIVQGQADIYMMSESGKKYTQVIYQDGDFIGEIEIFDWSPSLCSVEALTELTVIRILVDDFLDWLKNDIHMSNYFNRNLTRYLYNLSKKAGMDNLYTLKYRLSHVLLNNMTSYQDNGSFLVNMNKNQICNHLAVTTRSINRILQEWKEGGVVKIESDSIIILNKEQLLQEKELSLE